METDQPKKKTPIKPVVFAILVLTCILMVRFTPIKEQLTLDSINQRLSFLIEFFNQPYGPAIFLLVTVGVILLQVPGLTMAVVGGYVYPLWEGFILSLVGATIGVSITFLVARYFLREFFRPRIAKSKVGRYIRSLEDSGLLATIFLRILMTMAPPLNWFLGATNVKFRDYVAGSFVGMAPMVFLVVYLVDKLKKIESMKDLIRPETIIALVLFGGLFLAVFLLRNRFGSNEGQHDKEAAK